MIDREPSARECAEAHMEFTHQIKPIIKAITDTYAVSLPVITIVDGVVHTEYKHSEETQRLLDMADRSIEHIADIVKRKLASGYFKR